MRSTAPVNGLDPTGSWSPDEALDWARIDWASVERDVRRLRQRIFTASRNNDLRLVRRLRRLMLRSRAAALVAVRRVRQINAGRSTAGIDGRIVLLASLRAELAVWVQARMRGSGSWAPLPVRRVFIPKSGGKQRPLGIPVIADRALGTVRSPIPRVPARAGLPSRDRGHLRHLPGAHGPSGCGSSTLTWHPRSTESITTSSLTGSGHFPHGD